MIRTGSIEFTPKRNYKSFSSLYSLLGLIKKTKEYFNFFTYNPFSDISCGNIIKNYHRISIPA